MHGIKFSDKIDEDDSRDIKERYKGELLELEYKLSVLVASEKEDDLADKISKALDIVTNISERYENASVADKRALVSLIYPEKIIFDGDDFQTPKMNIVAQCIYQYNNGLGNKKNRHRNVKSSNVGLVNLTGRYSNSFFKDLESVLSVFI